MSEGYQHFDNAKSFMNTMKKRGRWDNYKDLLEGHANFLDGALINGVVIRLYNCF